jgi:DNA repair protein RadC
MISEGTVDRSLASPREIYLEALKTGATGVVLLHNHPSGDCEPSTTDLEITDQI